jgi:hypothetical protein
LFPWCCSSQRNSAPLTSPSRPRASQAQIEFTGPKYWEADERR